jgi:hypothetical protein
MVANLHGTLIDWLHALQKTAKSMRAKTLVDKDQALVDSLSTRVLALVDKTS